MCLIQGADTTTCKGVLAEGHMVRHPQLGEWCAQGTQDIITAVSFYVEQSLLLMPLCTCTHGNNNRLGSMYNI